MCPGHGHVQREPRERRRREDEADPGRSCHRPAGRHNLPIGNASMAHDTGVRGLAAGRGPAHDGLEPGSVAALKEAFLCILKKSHTVVLLYGGLFGCMVE